MKKDVKKVEEKKQDKFRFYPNPYGHDIEEYYTMPYL